MANSNRVRFLLNWNHFHEHLASSMARLMVDSTYSDVIIATGDKRMIYGHRFVLANSSKYFHRLLKQMNRQRGIQLVVALPEVKYEVLKVLMNYMYRGETQVSHDLLPTVIKAGRMLEINGLVDLNETDKITAGATIWPYNNGENQNQPSNQVPQPAQEAQEQEPRAEAKSRARTGSSRSNGKRQARRQMAINGTTEHVISKGGVTIRRFRPILPKDEEVAEKTGKNDCINLPVKRKYSRRDPEKETPRYPPPTATVTMATRNTMQHENPVVKIKRERLDDDVWQIQNPPAQEVTIKTELPFEIDEMNNIHFDELYCDFCKEGYSTHDEWVRHAAHQQAARMQQAQELQQMEQMQQLQQMQQMQQMEEMHQVQQLQQMHQMQQIEQIEQMEHVVEIEQEDPDQEEQEDTQAENDEGTETVYNCVICSEAMYSASEWIQHIRVWHTDAEPLNKASTRRSGRERDPRLYK